MSDGKHTPGPWDWYCRGDELVGADCTRVIRIAHDDDGSPELSIGEADSALIAAAPDLLEALEFFIDDENPCRYDHNGWCQEHGGMINGKCANALAMAVVAKAKGETK